MYLCVYLYQYEHTIRITCNTGVGHLLVDKRTAKATAFLKISSDIHLDWKERNWFCRTPAQIRRISFNLPSVSVHSRLIPQIHPYYSRLTDSFVQFHLCVEETLMRAPAFIEIWAESSPRILWTSSPRISQAIEHKLLPIPIAVRLSLLP